MSAYAARARRASSVGSPVAPGFEVVDLLFSETVQFEIAEFAGADRLIWELQADLEGWQPAGAGELEISGESYDTGQPFEWETGYRIRVRGRFGGGWSALTPWYQETSPEET